MTGKELIGKALPNGAVVLNVEGGIVLCWNSREFVTWQINETTLEAYWGHYFPATDFEEAVKDFVSRVNS